MIADRPSVDLRVRQNREDVVLRIPATLLGHLVEVVEEILHRTGRTGRARPPQFGIVATEVLLGHLQDEGRILDGGSKDHRHGLKGIPYRNVTHEVTSTALLLHLVDVPPREPRDLVFQ
jgi:hypothetical protein